MAWMSWLHVIYIITTWNILFIKTINCEPAEFFERIEKKRSVGGANKSWVSVNKNFCLGPLFFYLSRVCSHQFVYQSDIFIRLNLRLISSAYASFFSLRSKNSAGSQLISSHSFLSEGINKKINFKKGKNSFRFI